eukprot:9293734-Ditylum_brightwellii.AAC.1
MAAISESHLRFLFVRCQWCSAFFAARNRDCVRYGSCCSAVVAVAVVVVLAVDTVLAALAMASITMAQL